MASQFDPGNQTPPRVKPRFLRYGYLVAGLALCLIGSIGVVVPLLPTTIFLILAAGCFARSSPRLEAWLTGHPVFGKAISGWRENGAISRTGKRAAITGMATGFLLMLLVFQPPAIVLAITLVMCTAVSAWMWRRPEE